MKAIWTESKPEYHGDIVSFDTMMTWPKPVQKPHPPVILGGAFPWAARRAVRYGDGWYPNAASGDPAEYIPAFRKMAQEAGRDPKSLSLRIGGAPDDTDKLKRFASRREPGEHQPSGGKGGRNLAASRPLGKCGSPADRMTP
jgi:alkanesulfonate monooxygenase SsuD/methylene tetrahydromethanopterin reductase-like flavin-dependent oxidoreductase (luciferase family)